MRLVIHESTGQDKLTNQIMANINYYQNSMSIIKNKLNNKMKTESDKKLTEKNKLYFIRFSLDKI